MCTTEKDSSLIPCDWQQGLIVIMYYLLSVCVLHWWRHATNRGIDPVGWGPDYTLKICRRVRVCSDPWKCHIFSFKTYCCRITARFTTSRMNSWTLSLHWSCLCWRCYHPYIWSAPNRQCPPINAFAVILGFKLSWPNTKLQNVGTGDPPLKILIDGVPVEGVEAFIYFGSKQILMATADRMFYAGLDLPVQWWILYRVYGIAVISVSAPKYTCIKHW